jgi:tetratricopeptide (TPR) repeat protein
MSSIIEGCNYDIFISYRQKDNRGERWVSEFVEALKTELESTLKEDVSIYFDENPHDGLLETHDVDASLKEKLKCLIFIPVISRTYCDPRAFAWQHEFLAFIGQASADNIGLKVTLPNGNVATRVLPIRIHELGAEDTMLCETALGSVLRGVDFIYKAPGVNRPLRQEEDHPKDNLNKTYYRDQINKVANAIDSILKGLKYGVSAHEERMNQNHHKNFKTTVNTSWLINRVLPSLNKNRHFRIFIYSILLILCFLLIFKFIYLPTYGNTVAILPFGDLNRDSSLVAIGDTLMRNVYEKLRETKGLIVRSTYVSFKYRNTTKSLKELRRELKANYFIAGNLSPAAGKVNIHMELIKARNTIAKFSKDYTKEYSQISVLATEIASNISNELIDVHSNNEKLKEKELLTNNPYAYLYSKAGNTISDDSWFYFQYGNILMDSSSFQEAINKYDAAIKMDPKYALAYAKRSIARSRGIYAKQLDSTHIEKSLEDIKTALIIDSTLTEIQNALGFYYYYGKKKPEVALKYFENAAVRDPENFEPAFYMAIVYRRMGDWTKSQELINKVLKLEPADALYLTNIGLSYTYLHKYDSALIYHQKAIDVMPTWPAPYKNMIETSLLKNGNTAESRRIFESAIIKTRIKEMNETNILLFVYEGKFQEALTLATQTASENFRIAGSKLIYIAFINSYLKRSGEAIKYYDSSLVVLKNELLKTPDNEDIQGYIGIALAGKGNNKEALAEGVKAITMAGHDGLGSSDMKINMAKIYTLLGDYENALKLIAELLEKPSCLSAGFLKIDPIWKPLTTKPEFQLLIKKYSKN